jgi:hypothetical protein
VIAGWTPGIGDPTIIGWITVLNYCLGAFFCYRATQIDWRNSGIWTFLGICLFLLAVNKQLDLQSFFTQLARNTAKAGGWFEDRRTFQREFIIVLSVLSMCGCAGILFLIRKRSRQIQIALIGFILLVSFIVIRAASFHHVDVMLGYAVGKLALNQMLENAGIFVIMAGAIMAVRYPHKRK